MKIPPKETTLPIIWLLEDAKLDWELKSGRWEADCALTRPP